MKITEVCGFSTDSIIAFGEDVYKRQVQLREKELPEADVQKEAEELLELCHRYGVKLILDDDVELAAKVGADWVHIGQSDMELAHAREILGPEMCIRDRSYVCTAFLCGYPQGRPTQ